MFCRDWACLESGLHPGTRNYLELWHNFCSVELSYVVSDNCFRIRKKTSQCDLCDARFAENFTLKTHMTSAHKGKKP